MWTLGPAVGAETPQEQPVAPSRSDEDRPLGCPAALTRGDSMAAAFRQPWRGASDLPLLGSRPTDAPTTLSLQRQSPKLHPPWNSSEKNELLPQSFETVLVRMNICRLDQRSPTSDARDRCSCGSLSLMVRGGAEAGMPALGHGCGYR